MRTSMPCFHPNKHKHGAEVKNDQELDACMSEEERCERAEKTNDTEHKTQKEATKWQQGEDIRRRC